MATIVNEKAGSSSITNQLLDVLKFDGEDEYSTNVDVNDKSNTTAGGASAARELIEARKQTKEKLASFVAPKVAEKTKISFDPIYDQIASSTTDAPTHWKNASGKKKNTTPVITNAKRKKVAKGEAYAERHSHKLSSQNHRSQRMYSLKSVY